MGRGIKAMTTRLRVRVTYRYTDRRTNFTTSFKAHHAVLTRSPLRGHWYVATRKSIEHLWFGSWFRVPTLDPAWLGQRVSVRFER